MTATKRDYFAADHLPPHLQRVADPFRALLCEMDRMAIEEANVDMDEIDHGMRKLLEAKDCFVRAHVGASK